ncbi:MAG: Fpg/Nei family DNA glycosylase [Hamadaea sp.]|nr:Fpg/Nei family DNA glycosylase [Hamadaea sp.]
MPEGDTVWNTARALERGLVGATLTGSDFRVPQLATVDLTGRTVLSSASRGKHLLLRFDGDLSLHSHLRMDGSWRIYGPAERWSGTPAHQIRVVLRTPSAVAVGRHLHELKLLPTPQEGRLLAHLGPDLLGDDWDAAEAARRLAARPDAEIAEALLDQRCLAGIGNLYKAELLYLRGIWPWTPVRDVDDLPGLADLAHRVLNANKGRWTQSTTGSLRRGETTYVYGRRAQPCRRCGTPIRKADQGSRLTDQGSRAELGDRVTYWCPVCQPAPA